MQQQDKKKQNVIMRHNKKKLIECQHCASAFICSINCSEKDKGF